MKSKVGLIFVLLFFFAACARPGTSEPVTVIQSTQTPNPSVTPNSSFASLTKSLTPTPPSEQIAITATQQALHTTLDKYCETGPAWAFRFSPTGEWVAVMCSWDTMEFVRLDEARNWEVSSDTLINPFSDYFIGIDHWTTDDTFAYIQFDPHTDGYWEPFHQGVVLYRLDLETGQIGEVLPLGTSDWIFYSFEFSPGDERLAYIVTDHSPVTLKIRDLQTGAEQTFDFESKYNTGGGFVWSPDGQKLVFSVTQFDTNTYKYIATSIILWDTDASELTELVKDHPSLMSVTEWIDETKIILKAEFLDQDQTQMFELDLKSNTLTEIHP